MTVAKNERANWREKKMYPNYSQFPEHAPDPKKVPKKIKSSGGANPYKQLNQMLDFQIKQAKLEKIKEKKERK